MPDGVSEPEQVFRILFEPQSGKETTTQTTLATYLEIKSAVHDEATVAARKRESVLFGQGLNAIEVASEFVTSSYLPMLGVPPHLGRFWNDEELQNGGQNTAIVSHRLWRHSLHASPEALGSTIKIGGTAYTVVGVAGEGFRGIDRVPVDLWVPLRERPNIGLPGNSNSQFVSVLARVRNGEIRTVEEKARRAVEHHAAASFEPPSRVALIALNGPQSLGPEWGTTVESARRIRLGASFLAMLVCANLINLALVRMVARRAEYRILAAIGASRVQLVARDVCETVIAVILAGSIAVLLVIGAGEVAYLLVSSDVAEAIRGSSRYALWTVGQIVVAASFLSAVPAIFFLSARLDSIQLKRAVGDGALLRRIVVGIQCALAVVLLVGAGHVGSSFRGLKALDLGFDPDGLLLIGTDFETRPPMASATAMYREWAQRLSDVPGVETVSLANGLPFWTNWAITVGLPQSVWNGPNPVVLGHAVEPLYFRATRLKVRRGRLFSQEEMRGEGKSVLISESFAAAYWAGRDPLGTCLTLGDDTNCSKVIGVVADTPTWSILAERKPELYVPLLPDGFGTPYSLGMVLRTQSDDVIGADQIRALLEGTDQSVKYVMIQSARAFVNDELRPWRVATTVFAVFGAVAIVVFLVGLHGLLSFAVEQEKVSIGIHMALGASPRTIRRRVVMRAATTCVIGAGVGVIASVVALPVLVSPVPGTSWPGPSIFLGAVVLTVVAGLGVSYLPARRASLVSCAALLRSA